jgi:hypothetical protein
MQTLELDPVIIAVIAGVWNAGHTLQQRYGITRIYGRKVGQADGTIELAVVGWFAFQWLRQERSAAEINRRSGCISVRRPAASPSPWFRRSVEPYEAVRDRSN